MTTRPHDGERTGARAVVETLAALGVDTVFGLPGVHNLALWRELAESPLRLVGVRHEQAAAYAADGYARASGRLGVALVTSGPGAANTLAAVGEAGASHSPVVVIATDVPLALRRPGVVRGLLHESRDQCALFEPLVKRAEDVAAADALATAVERAARTALAAPSGPVYVGVPADLLDAPAGAGTLASADALEASAAAPDESGDAAAEGETASRAVAVAAGLLRGAARPLIWSGGGAAHAGAGGVIARLAELLAAPVLTTYQGRGILPPEHPCAVPGPAHAPEVGALWDAADVVLAVGSDLDAMMTQNWRMPRPPSLVALNVDAADASKNWAPDVLIEADARAGVQALVDLLEGGAARGAAVARGADAEAANDPPGRESPAALATRLGEIGDAVRARIAADEPQALLLLDALARGLPPEALIVCDMCIPGYWIGGFHPVPAPRRLAYPVGWGTLGFAFPAALGAAFAHDGPTLCVAGDGGFLMACGELATAAQERIPLTVLLFDDGGYGMLRFDAQRARSAPFGVDLASPDFVMLARSFGIDAEHVALDALAPALASHIARPEPSMIVVAARLRPPPTTSPRWYRTAQEEPV